MHVIDLESGVASPVQQKSQHKQIYANAEWYIRFLLNDPKTKNLFIYSTALFLFSIFEFLIYGFMYTHSLYMIFSGLISFCIFFSFLIKIISILVANKNITSNKYSYGFDRVEVVLQFSNSMFCIFICFAMIVQCLHRYVDPHEISLYYSFPCSFLVIIRGFSPLLALH
jgi:Co/Zn/Cd efflux system component